MIQRFQESQLNSLQVTHKLIEANNKWHESTKDVQKSTESKLGKIETNIDFKLSNMIEKQQNILEASSENMQCRFIDMKNDINEIHVKVNEV